MRLSVISAFIIVCVVWGSTYLAISFAIETVPPFFMAGIRWAIAGILLYAATRLRGAPAPSRTHWYTAFAIGGLMLLFAHGAVVWAEQWIPSGVTSILVATIPLWIVFIESAYYKTKPDAKIIVALVAGFAGVILLVGDLSSQAGSTMGLVAAVGLLFGTLAWSLGSFYSRIAKLPESHLLAVAQQMIAGGILLFLASFVTNEWMNVKLDAVSMQSLAALLYLIVFGSLIAFTSYIWLLKQIAPSRIVTYAYVNPIVALLLGWAFRNEQPTLRSIAATAIVLTSVAVATLIKSERKGT